MVLAKYGFVCAGEWNLSTEVNSGIKFALNLHANDRVVYAFVVDSLPKYIGICDKDSTSLKKRMSRYQSMQGRSNEKRDSTNKRVAQIIRELLQQGKTVSIYALKPIQGMPYVDINVDLVKGLENPFVAIFQPEWNR